MALSRFLVVLVVTCDGEHLSIRRWELADQCETPLITIITYPYHMKNMV